MTPAFGGQYSIQLSYGRIAGRFYRGSATVVTPDALLGRHCVQ